MFLSLGSRKLVLGWILALSLLYLITSRKDSVTYDTYLTNVQPVKVWEYMMDFNNMKKLNPTILDFSITYDTNEDGFWEYGVKYTEHLHQLPFIHNNAHATYQIISNSGIYYILSNHQTCFMGNYICLNSSSIFIIQNKEKSEGSTHCIENIIYECPRIFSFLCYREVMYQRRMISLNLKKVFSKT